MPKTEPERGAKEKKWRRDSYMDLGIMSYHTLKEKFTSFETYQVIVIFLFTDTCTCFITSPGYKPEHWCLTYCKSESYVWKKNSFAF